MTDFLRSIEGAQTAKGEQELIERVAEAGISSASLKKQLKKLTKGMFLLLGIS